ncbi:MAG: hypothetical protein U9Q77_02545 [Candidatus Marinimicrobia bacterium]|nr:hypothetical protein [Candidatus Neomarinimicrobiota bacterium]
MRLIRTTLFLLIFSMLRPDLSAEEVPTGSELLNLMQKNWEQIEDYEVDITLSLDIPGFRMPSRKIHYLFKAPDKSKVEVKGFAIIPKQGIQPFFTFLKDSVNLKLQADTVVNGRSVFEVAIEDSFMNQAGQITFFIDQLSGNIYEAWVTHDSTEFFRMKSEYTSIHDIWLPLATDITMRFPPEFKNLQRLGKKPTDMKTFEAGMTDEWLMGSISIKFKRYKVNQGIPDYVFEENEEDIIQD